MNLLKCEITYSKNGYGLKRGDVEISEISTNREFVQSLIDAINLAGDVDDVHIPDIVEDYISL